jgi:hypothetical protein
MIYDGGMSDQKYRQRGYQDHERTEREKSGLGGPSGPRAERNPGPRGRGLGMPTATVFRCGSCGTLHEVAYVLEGASCSKCRSDLHCCKNCRHFDSAANNECRQPVPARIVSKTKGNSCSLFAAQLKQEQQQEAGGHRDARSAFDALFKF